MLNFSTGMINSPFASNVVDNTGISQINFMEKDAVSLILNTIDLNFGFVSMYLEFCYKVFSYQSTSAPNVKKSICLFPFTS